MPEVAVTHVALVNAPLLSAVRDHGVGRQMPSSLLMDGGALRGRAAVTLIDAAGDHLTEDDTVRRVVDWGPTSPWSPASDRPRPIPLPAHDDRRDRRCACSLRLTVASIPPTRASDGLVLKAGGVDAEAGVALRPHVANRDMSGLQKCIASNREN
jgi:hypothetical protein